MATKLFKHPSGHATYIESSRSHEIFELKNENIWLYTTDLTYTSTVVVLTSKKAGAFWRFPSMWENEQERKAVEDSNTDPFKAFLEFPFNDIRKWYHSDAARLFKEDPLDFFVIKPTHGYGQEEALKWFISELKKTFGLEPTVAPYVPKPDQDKPLWYSTAEFNHDPDDGKYDAQAKKWVQNKPKVYVNGEHIRPVKQPRPTPPTFP